MSLKSCCACNLEDNSKADATVEPENKNYCKKDFKTERLFNQGIFGPIKLVRLISSDKLVVLKCVHKSKVLKDDIASVLMEPNLHKRLNNNPHIIQFYGLFSDIFGRYYVLEYAPNGTLVEKMWNAKERKCCGLPNEVAARYAKHIACGLDYMHRVGILHGDIKPENILLDINDNAKIADFGLAWPLVLDTKLRGKVGTLEYMAPEIIMGGTYDHKIDNWSLGVLCYELLVGRPPFKMKKDEDQEKKICSVDFDYPQIVDWPAKSLISQLLLKDIKSRIPLHRVLIHPWILMEGARFQISRIARREACFQAPSTLSEPHMDC